MEFHLRQGAPPARTHFLGVLACIAGVSEPRFRNKIGSFFLALMHHKNGGRSVIACKRKKQREEASTVAFFRNPIQDPGPRTENRIGSRFSPGSHPVLIFLTGSRLSVLIRFSHSRPTENRVQNLGSRFSGHPVLAFSSGSRFSPGFWMQVRRRLKLESRGSPVLMVHGRPELE